jgi:hypothetical protein
MTATVHDRLAWDPLEAPADAVLGPVFQIGFAVPAGQAHVIVVGERPDLLEDARDRVLQLGRLWTTTVAGSDFARLAQASGRPVVVAPETLLLLGLAGLGREQTRGRFHPFAVGTDPVLDESALTAALSAAPDPVLIGLAAAVTADLVAQETVDAGAQGVCVNVAGQVRVAGLPPRPAGWELEVGRAGTPVRLVDGGVCWEAAGRTSSVVVSASAWHARVLAVAAVSAPERALELLVGQAAEGKLWTADRPPVHTAGWPHLSPPA